MLPCNSCPAGSAPHLEKKNFASALGFKHLNALHFYKWLQPLWKVELLHHWSHLGRASHNSQSAFEKQTALCWRNTKANSVSLCIFFFLFPSSFLFPSFFLFPPSLSSFLPPFFFSCTAAEVPRDVTPETVRTIHSKGTKANFDGKSTQIGSQDFCHENQQNCHSNFWGCKKSPFVAALAECSLCTSSWFLFLCWLLELIFRMDNSTLSAEALNSGCKPTSISHRGIAGILLSSMLMLECLTPDLVVSF